MTNITILKLGGSVVTDKETTEFNVRKDVLRATFTEIKDWTEQHPEEQLILLHGAGGHIHNLAKQYELTTSCAGNPAKIKHALEVQDICQVLNRELVGIAKEAGLDLTSLTPHEVVMNNEGTFEDLDVVRLRELLSTHTIPVMYGTMVPDHVHELSICSGDRLVTALAATLPVSRILFASDIDGIYTDDPHRHNDAELITELTTADLIADSLTLGDSHNVDVTDGLRGKLADVQSLFENCITLGSIEIYNGLKAANTKKALIGEQFAHTIITN